MKFVIHIHLAFCLQSIIFSCKCPDPKIIHLDFCDHLNETNQDASLDKKTRLKSIYFLVNENNSTCWSDKNLGDFIKNDKFIQQEIQKNYDRLRLTFYKKSSCTEEVLKNKFSRNLDYCQDDIIVEFGWDKGKLLDTFYYEKGVIKGTENIILINPKDTSKTK